MNNKIPQEKQGMEKWIEEYNKDILEMQTLREDNLKFINEFNKKEKSQKKRKNEEGDDDDGWTVVTKKGRNPGLARKESVDNKLASKDMMNKGLPNFYRFQMKESKIKHIENLRKQFEIKSDDFPRHHFRTSVITSASEEKRLPLRCPQGV